MMDADRIIEEVKAEILPFDSWERLSGESSAAFAAFCVYRDFGVNRNIRRAIETIEKDETKCFKRYRVWRNWATQFKWRERAGDFDKYLEKLKQAEMRKTIEVQGEKHRMVTGKMLDVVQKKLDTMNAEDLTQGSVSEWVEVAIKAEREISNTICGIVTSNGKAETKQGELNFVSDFKGL